MCVCPIIACCRDSALSQQASVAAELASERGAAAEVATRLEATTGQVGVDVRREDGGGTLGDGGQRPTLR